MKNFYLVVGLMGSGKDSLVNTIRETIPMNLLKSYTTRAPRYDGEDTHTFIDKYQYSALTNKVAIFYLNGEYYCATEEQVENNDIYIIDNEGAKQFFDRYKGNKTVKMIYIDVPSDIRKQRMINRGDNQDDVYKRVEHDSQVIEIKDKADIIIENINFEEAKQQLIDFINVSERR